MDSIEVENEEFVGFIESSCKRAILVSVYKGGSEKTECEENLQELKRLVDTLGMETLQGIPCSIKKFEASTYLGKGKLEELSQIIREQNADILIIDDEISPGQQRNLEKLFQIPVLDRTEVILEVFSKHARTKEAKLQIELAKIRYELPRLKRLWTHLSRQRGGGVNMKGEGEKQIEIDKRILKAKVERLESELKKVRDYRMTQRGARQKSLIPTFAIIGYTNVGKSTLLKALTEADVLVEDKLFATLDTTTRKFVLPNQQEVLLIDTVGFIRKIPYTLVKAFRSTLEEAVEADILLHIIDASHPMREEQAKATFDVLKELNATEKPVITVLNKVDLCTDLDSLDALQHKYPKTVQISALTGMGFNKLAELMIQELEKGRQKVVIRVPQKDYSVLQEIEKYGQIHNREYEGNDIILFIEGPNDIVNRLKKYWT
ncbi:MAG: GTPase HflX [Chlamydiales bacterium]|nr:GTPase HflX [Chlamydiales bacterium]